MKPEPPDAAWSTSAIPGAEDLRAVVAAGDIVWALDFDGAAWRSADDRSSTALPFVGPGTGVAARDIAWTKAGYVMIGGNGEDGSQGPLV